MKQSRQSFANFTIFACLILMLAAIILKVFLEDGTWRILMSVVSVASALLAVSDLFKKSADDQRSMNALSAAILNPLYNEFAERGLFTDAAGKDLRKERYSDENVFERSLRNISDQRDRAVRELIWERRNNDKRPSRARVNSLVRIVFLVLSAVVLIGGLVLLFFFPQLMPEVGMYHIDIAIAGSLVIALACAFSAGGNFAFLQRIEMLLGLKERCEDIMSRPKPQSSPFSDQRPVWQDTSKKPETPSGSEPSVPQTQPSVSADALTEPVPPEEAPPVVWEAEPDVVVGVDD